MQIDSIASASLYTKRPMQLMQLKHAELVNQTCKAPACRAIHTQAECTLRAESTCALDHSSNLMSLAGACTHGSPCHSHGKTRMSSSPCSAHKFTNYDKHCIACYRPLIRTDTTDSIRQCGRAIPKSTTLLKRVRRTEAFFDGVAYTDLSARITAGQLHTFNS